MSVHNIKGNVSQLPVVDSTLTRSGYSADAKATGDAIAENKQRIEREAARLDSELDVERGKIDQIANNQIPEEYLKAAVDAYVEENTAGLATQESLETVESELKSDLSELDGLFEFTNLVNPNSHSIVEGYFILPNGGLNSADAWCYLPIEVVGGKNISVYKNYHRVMICFYDASGNVVEGGTDSSVSAVISIPNNATTMRISTEKQYLNEIRICYSDVLIMEYESFGFAKPTEKLNVYSKEEIDASLLTEKETTSLLGLVPHELITDDVLIDGYYVSCANGILNELAHFTATDFIPVIEGATYTINGGASGSQVAFYDKGKFFVSGIEIGRGNSFIVPSNVCFMRWCAPTANKPSYSLKVNPVVTPNTKVVVRSGGSILEGLLEAYNLGAKKVIVEAGEYDIIAEYESHFGNDYFANYQTNYNNLVNGVFDRGLWLEDMEIVFSTGAKVVCHYTGNNNNVIGYFSPFNCGNNAIIDGLVLDSSNTRYGIHPDFNSGNDVTYMKILNCDLKNIRTGSEQAIGAGFGVHVDWLIENTIFRSEGATIVFRVHNNISSEAQSRLVVKNCYIDGGGCFSFRHYSTSEKESTIMVTGCSYKTEPQVRHEDLEAGTPENMKLVAWNNELRTE